MIISISWQFSHGMVVKLLSFLYIGHECMIRGGVVMPGPQSWNRMIFTNYAHL